MILRLLYSYQIKLIDGEWTDTNNVNIYPITIKCSQVNFSPINLGLRIIQIERIHQYVAMEDIVPNSNKSLTLEIIPK